MTDGNERRTLQFEGEPPEWLPALLNASEFSHDVLRADADLRRNLQDLVADPRPPAERWQEPSGDIDLAVALRRFRRAESVRLIARDLLGLDDVPATLAGSSRLAECCIVLALTYAQAQIELRHGALVDDQGDPRRPVVFALGKLGGGELNFSSDVDLVFAYTGEGGGDSTGDRSLGADAWHARIVQRVAQLLGEITAHGFVYRVDLRLRPFGQSGKASLPFTAMEQYFQREGRDWERYAWQKARPVAGDIEAGERFLETLRPFVYRRYLDYNAIDALREMKAQIDLEVQRQELVDDIKLGRGGIREVEFLVQVVQLVRGGRDPSLRQRGLLAAMAACAEAGYIAPDQAAALHAAYLFLRRVENRLQMFRDAQTQRLPVDATERQRIAAGLGYQDWTQLRAELDRHRHLVASEFAQVLGVSEPAVKASGDALLAVWRSMSSDTFDPAMLAATGVAIDEALRERLRNLALSANRIALSARARSRLDHLMAALLDRLRADGDRQLAASAIADLLQVLLRRSNYLALLEQQPAALERLLSLADGSRSLIRQVIEQPLLLDDVFDPRQPPPPDEAEIASAVAAVASDENDPEAVLAALAEVKSSLHFRLGLAVVDRSLAPDLIAARLAAVADAVVKRVLQVATASVASGYGWPPGANEHDPGLILIGYGSLGAEEMGFASDLDLVFLFDGALASVETSGRSAIEGQRFYARVVQKLISFLSLSLPGGRLYAIDPRLRPDGAKGALVATLESWIAYQKERAWTWEQQALVRARRVAGASGLDRRFDDERRLGLTRQREIGELRTAVVGMRERLRQELDRSRDSRFDLKQGHGGLVDLEFLLQYLVLAHAHEHPKLVATGRTSELLKLVAQSNLLADGELFGLLQAHERLLRASLQCTLDDKPRIVPVDDDLAAATALISATFRRILGD